MSNNELETLRARVAELSAAVGRWEAMAKSVQDHRIEIQRERDAARASAARLREALAEIARPKRGGIEANDSDEEWFEYLRNALERERAIARAAISATDSAEWLAKHDAEVRAPLEKQANGREKALRALVDSLRSQLVAATNDAARAELRARNASELWSRFDALSASNAGNSDNRFEMAFVELEEEIRAALAASPDSDARLREVMLRVGVAVFDATMEAMPDCDRCIAQQVAATDTVNIEHIIDEVLGVKS